MIFPTEPCSWRKSWRWLLFSQFSAMFRLVSVPDSLLFGFPPVYCSSLEDTCGCDGVFSFRVPAVDLCDPCCAFRVRNGVGQIDRDPSGVLVSPATYFLEGHVFDGFVLYFLPSL